MEYSAELTGQISDNFTSLELETFFLAYAKAITKPSPMQHFAEDLVDFFATLPAIPADEKKPEILPPPYFDLVTFFTAAQPPLDMVKDKGGFINLWDITGIKGYEVRTAGALAGLWKYEFGGKISRKFMASYLERIIPSVNWHDELQTGYGIQTEVNPLGDQSDRVDLIIETTRYLIGIEVKINAGLGKNQLERYETALTARSKHIQKEPILIFLAPFKPPPHSDALSSSWGDVAAAARQAAKCPHPEKTVIHHLITQFASHIANH